MILRISPGSERKDEIVVSSIGFLDVKDISDAIATTRKESG